uniref:Reverse transcriptase domain-containing protein n=1 Tax=Tanacetum cinerariifolium TaxID=118510 RepID=A0A6L2KNC1_TANCI|nr:reverse transcriptase domain-containing protein [Tanacetum cinerariifolium]
MRTRNSYFPNNSSATIPRRRNKRHTPNIAKPGLCTIVEKADNRTMEELLQAPMEGYGEAIVILEINVDHFEIKMNLLQLVQANPYHGFERENHHTHINNFKRITLTLKFKDVPNDVIKLMMFSYSLKGNARVWYDKEPPNSILTWEDLVNKFVNQFFPPSKSTHLRHEISCFTQRFEETFREAWERFKEMLRAMNMTYKENASKSRDRIDKLADQISTLVDIFAKKIVTPAPIKADEESCVTCGGAHAYYNCLNTDSNQPSVCVATGTYNQVAPQNRASNFMAPPGFAPNQSSTSGTHPSNTIPNPKGEIKEITTQSGVAYEGPSIPTPKKVVERETKETTDKDQTNFQGSTAHIQPPVTPILKPDVLKTLHLHFDICFADALLLMPKFASTIKSFLTNKDKLFELAKIPLNENCSAMLLKKLPEKLGDPGKFLIPCDFPGMHVCYTLADLGVAEDVFVKVGKFHFLTDFVVVDFEADPRVPLISGRSLLRSGHALNDVYGEEITLRVNEEAVTFNLNQTTRYSSTYDDLLVNRIDIIGVAREDPWVSPIHYVPKKGGITVVENKNNELIPTQLFTGWRVSINYRKLNDATRKDHFPFPFIDQMLERLAGNEFYCFLDGFSGYFQISINLPDQEKITFTCLYGTFAYRIMPFGLCNSAWTFQSFYRRFIQGFSKIVRPMTHLLKKETPFLFFNDCIDAFETLKKKLTEALLLVILDWNLPFEHTCDASDFAIGAVLGQLYTDHSALKYLLSKQDAKPRLIRWVLLLQEFDIIIRDKKGMENLAADHFPRIENPHKDVFVNKDINENFPLETLGKNFSGSTPWFADFSNFHAGNFIVKRMSSQQKKNFFKDSNHVKVANVKENLPQNVIHVCEIFNVPGIDFMGQFPSSQGNRAIISDRGTYFCNDKFAKVMSKYGVTHHLSTAYHPQTSGQVEVSNRGLKRILERTVGENRASWSEKLDDALWAFRTAYKTPIGCTPYKLVYGKSCHLPIELEHTTYWALKHVNFDRKTVGDHGKLQLNELNELRDQAYENSLIYKEKAKKIHESKIKNRIFNVGDRVLLFNYRLKIFSGKLKTRWSGRFTITKVFLYRTIELSQPNGPNFKLGTFRETLAEGEEGTFHLGPERPRVYSDLSSNEKERYNADIQATNILLQGLPKDIYALINYYTDAKEIWDNVKMLLEGSKLPKENRESQLPMNVMHLILMLMRLLLHRPCSWQIDNPWILFMRKLYVKDDTKPVVQNNVSSVPNDASMMIINEMHEQTVQYVSVKAHTKVVDASLTAKLAIYREQVKLPKPYYNEQRKVAIGYKNPLYLTRAKQVQLALYNGHEIIKTHHVSAIVQISKDTLEIAEITMNKKKDKMKTPLWTEQNINIRPPDYSNENYLATFTPQTQLTLEQIFWSKDVFKTVNEDVRLQALVDRKKVIVNEASIRSDLRLDDAEGTTCLPNAAIFEELARMGTYKSKRKQMKETKVPHTEPQIEKHIPTPSHDLLPSGEDRMQLSELMKICTNLSNKVLSLEKIKTNQAVKIEKLKKRVKKLEAEIDADEDLSLINKTTQDHGRMNNEDLFGVNDLDGDEVIIDVTTGENVEQDATVAGKDVSAAADEVVTTAESVKAKDKGKGIMVKPKKPLKKKDQIAFDEEVARKLNAQMKAEMEEEETIAREKDEENRALKREKQISIEERSKLLAKLIESRRNYFAAKKAKEIKNKPLIKAQQKSLMCTYMKNIERYKQKDFKGKSFDAIKNMFDKVYKSINTFVAMDSEVMEGSKKTQAKVTEGGSKRAGDEIEQESAKRQSLEKEDDTAELKRCLEIILEDDDDGRKSYFKIIRADGNSQNYLAFGTMFKNFNREDLEVLRSIVKERFKKTNPVNDMDNLLFQTLKTMFEHHVEDNIWKYQQGVVKVHNWKLYDSYGVCCVTIAEYGVLSPG